MNSLILVILNLMGPMVYAPADPTEEPTHNVLGGYIEACGNLPGMVGDDC